MLIHSFKYYLPLIQTPHKVWGNQSLTFNLLLPGNHLLSTTCLGLHHCYQNICHPSKYQQDYNTLGQVISPLVYLYSCWSNPKKFAWVYKALFPWNWLQKHPHSPTEWKGGLFMTSYVLVWANSDVHGQPLTNKTKQLSKQDVSKSPSLRKASITVLSERCGFFWRPLSYFLHSNSLTEF